MVLFVLMVGSMVRCRSVCDIVSCLGVVDMLIVCSALLVLIRVLWSRLYRVLINGFVGALSSLVVVVVCVCICVFLLWMRWVMLGSVSLMLS